MTKTNDLTEGKVSRVLLGFFFPMLFTNLLQQIYTFADSAIVGKGLGDNSLAAVGNMSALTLLIIGFAQGITNGFSVIIAQNFGSKDMSALRKSIAISIKLSLILSIILTAISLIFLKSVLIAMKTDEIIIEESLIYGYIIFGGLTATMAYNLCNMGFGTQAYNSTGANGTKWDGIKVGMVRIWNRLLSDEEININHNDTVNRLKTEPVAPTTATITLNGLEYGESSALGGNVGQTYVYIDAGTAGSDGAYFDDLVTASVTVPIGTEVNLYCYGSFGFDTYKKTIIANGDEVYEAKYDSLDSTWVVDR